MFMSKEKILIVDDDKINRILLTTNLEEQGYTVVSAENGRKALDCMFQEDFDLVLLDLVMPKMDGYQVLKEVKKDPHLKNIPIIIISAQDETENLVKCLEIGAVDYIPKPFDPEIIKTRIDTALASKRISSIGNTVGELSSKIDNMKRISELLDSMD